jgi:hypothetical protein
MVTNFGDPIAGAWPNWPKKFVNNKAAVRSPRDASLIVLISAGSFVVLHLCHHGRSDTRGATTGATVSRGYVSTVEVLRESGGKGVGDGFVEIERSAFLSGDFEGVVIERLVSAALAFIVVHEQRGEHPC